MSAWVEFVNNKIGAAGKTGGTIRPPQLFAAEDGRPHKKMSAVNLTSLLPPGPELRRQFENLYLSIQYPVNRCGLKHKDD